MINILYFLIALLVLAFMIFIHELGHYTAGRLLGFKILDFSIGFGPALFKFKRKEITYALRAIPLGGACRFYGEEDDKLDDPSAIPFNSQKPWKRLLVIFAGPLMNILFAYILAVVILAGYGTNEIVTYPNGEYAVMVVEVNEDGPAGRAGMLPEDMIVSVGGRDVASSEAEDKQLFVIDLIKAAPREGVSITVSRHGEEKELFLEDIYDEELGYNRVGVTIGEGVEFVRHGFFESIGLGGKYLFNIVKLTFEAIGKGFREGFREGEVSGVVGTVAITMNMASKGFYYVLLVMMIISMSLGIMNLLPILPMDGGHLLFDTIELIFRKPVPRKIQTVLSMIGIVLLLALMVYATIGDIMGIFKGRFNF